MANRLALIVSVALASLGAARGISAPLDFDQTVAPLLTRHCLDCHSGSKPKGKLDLTSKKTTFAGGKNGPSVVPGKPDASLLWNRVKDGEMPPKKKLTAEEQKLLHAWIAAGAAWGSDPIDPFRVTTEKRAGYDWWSLRPLNSAQAPVVKETNDTRNVVDAFVRARLETRGLRPSPEADRRTLIRRLSFDLLGLPPTPTEVERFVRDPDEQAYEKLVDRYLASPHYGERWARHWLDVVRYGESNGYERDLPRPNAWPYRDWVVQALNHDMPYDAFVRWQIAGDVLRPDDPESLIATGFLVAGPHDTVLPASDKMRQAMQQDEMEDVLATVGQAFLGLTVNCARCHDHKFDPISQRDYYRLVAALGGVQHGERELKVADGSELAGLRKRVDALVAQLAAIDEPVREAILAERAKSQDKPTAPRPLAQWDFTVDLRDRTGGLNGTAFGEARTGRDGLALDGRTGYVATEPLKQDLTAKTLEAWVRLTNLSQRGGGVIGVQTRDGVLFDALVFGEQEPGRWMAGSNFFKRTESFQGPTEATPDRELLHVAIAYHADGTVAAFRNGKPYGRPYKSPGPVTFKAGEAQVIFGVRHLPAGGNKMLAGLVTRARLYDRALSGEEIAASAGVANATVAEADIVARLDAGQRSRREQVRAELARTDAARAKLEASLVTKVYAVVPQQPGPTHVLIRGNVAELGEPVRPGGIAALPGADWHLPADTPESERRRRLAEWLTDAASPLLARVIVNRVWHYHFGLGLVDTPNDFGFNGGRPSHPELLDWLASEFVRQRWSLKALHRTLVLSATYRQASRPRPEAARVDAGNRLLWCRSPQRLEAETVRDAMLVASGSLDRTVGGRGYQDFKSYFFKGTQFYDPVAQVGPEFHRRSLYRMWARSGRNPFLDTFDCPDPSTTTPRRAVTTTPLQALTLLNNALVLDASDAFAERLRREAGGDIDRQIGRAYEIAYGRPPEAAETALVKPFVTRHGLAALCRVIFNSNEFIYVD
jgi:hypothetical protein